MHSQNEKERISDLRYCGMQESQEPAFLCWYHFGMISCSTRVKWDALKLYFSKAGCSTSLVEHDFQISKNGGLPTGTMELDWIFAAPSNHFLSFLLVLSLSHDCHLARRNWWQIVSSLPFYFLHFGGSTKRSFSYVRGNSNRTYGRPSLIKWKSAVIYSCKIIEYLRVVGEIEDRFFRWMCPAMLKALSLGTLLAGMQW